jgi:hypothetical protein
MEISRPSWFVQGFASFNQQVRFRGSGKLMECVFLLQKRESSGFAALLHV